MTSWPRYTVLLLAALAAELASAQENSPFAVVSAPGLCNDVCRLDDLNDLGVGWVRAAFYWPDVEVQQDRFEWAQPDLLMQGLEKRGLWLYWDFSYAPCWANGRPCQDGPFGPGTETSPQNWRFPPSSQADLYQYVHTVVSRYRHYNVYWGVWNEADDPNFYAGGGNRNANITRYKANELQTIVNAIRDADPSARIVIGDLSTQIQNPNNHALLRQVLDAVRGKFDVISLHIYGAGNGCNGRLSSLDALKGAITSWGYGNYPIWVTESGGGVNDFGSITGQNNYIRCFWAGMQTRPWWKKSFWYRYEFESNLTGLLDGGPNPCTYTPNSSFFTYKDVIANWPALPEAPSGLSAAPADGEVDLTWNAPLGAMSYTVKRSLTAGSHHVQIGSGIASLRFKDSSVNNGTTYFYVVTAQNSAGESFASNEVSATPDVDDPPQPGDEDTLTAGEALFANQEVTSADGRFHLYYQGDGNLVLYQQDWVPIWHSHTHGTSPGQAVMQFDGNFVVYDEGGTPVFHTNTWGNPGAYLVVQSDGRVVIYSSSGSPLWSTGG